MNEFVVANWSDLMDKFFINSWNSDIQRHRPPYVYRGLDDANYQLKTSLIRQCGMNVWLEKNLLRNFKKYAHRDAVEYDSIWNWLSLAEHHGLPTRLLDWTHSPAIAAHFAVSDIEKFDKDGVIWCVNFELAHRIIPSKLRSILERETAHLFTVEMLNNAVESLDKFDTLSRSAFVVFFEPPSLDDRIGNQYAVFSVVSNPKILLDTWLQNHRSLFHKIIIPASQKWEIRDKLDKLNINERMLFPGLDGVASWLARYYTPRNGNSVHKKNSKRRVGPKLKRR